MKPSVAKKAISLILLFGISSVGASTAQAQSEKLERANFANTKQLQGASTVFCFKDNNPTDGLHNQGNELGGWTTLAACNHLREMEGYWTYYTK